MKLPLIGKKKAPKAAEYASQSPSKPAAAARVETLSENGLSEPEIIRALRSDGYTPMEVDAAMKQALRRSALAETERPAPRPQQAAGRDFAAPPAPPAESDRRRIFPEEAVGPQKRPSPPFSNEEMRDIEELRLPELPELPERGEDEDTMEEEMPEDEFKIPGIGEEELPLLPKPKPTIKEAQVDKRREMEELAEAIFEEKADVFRREVDEVSDQIRRLESRIHMIEERFHKIEGEKVSEVDEIKKTIGDYRESMSEVSARMGSVEKTMKDSLMPMMQTLRALNDTVKDFKRS